MQSGQAETEAQPEQPAQSVQTVQAETETQPETPVETVQEGTEAQAEAAVIAATPEQAVQVQADHSAPADAAVETGNHREDETVAAVPESAAKEESTAAGEPDGTQAGASAGSSTGLQSKRKRFSRYYPYRRIRMTPEPNLRAVAAGIRIWPAAGSPLQQMLSGE